MSMCYAGARKCVILHDFIFSYHVKKICVFSISYDFFKFFYFFLWVRNLLEYMGVFVLGRL